MKEVIVKIKLPEQVTVHIPTFSDIGLEGVLDVIARDGRRLIEETITDRVLETFVKKHEKLIGKKVKELVSEKEEEIKKLIFN